MSAILNPYYLQPDRVWPWAHRFQSDLGPTPDKPNVQLSVPAASAHQPADQIAFSRGLTWLLSIYALQDFSAHYTDEKCCGEPAHQNPSQSLKRAEQPPLFWQDEVPVTDCDIGNPGKVKRRHNVGHAVLPTEKQCPDADLKQVNNN